MVNQSARRSKRSRFNGVSWIESERKWVARFWDTERKEQRTLGRWVASMLFLVSQHGVVV